ncbi:hypothetical protein [Azospirillum argentinense]|uniref:Uncharacterized protein n=1 Tax=Azospirillum brasilense TaxID=192 RepID=A0A4D8Q3Q5_AZOBR|nr:hypothetical protein [Azospirillum argentinense]QCO04874.1 hypothetical protein D3867_23745 [Azospirillum argentinense]
MTTNHAERLYSILLPEHFGQVKELMEGPLGRVPSDEEVRAFLTRHVDLLGMIVQYDEVETEARALIWEHCRSDFPPA